jgi:hypothetical protein
VEQTSLRGRKENGGERMQKDARFMREKRRESETIEIDFSAFQLGALNRTSSSLFWRAGNFYGSSLCVLLDQFLLCC